MRIMRVAVGAPMSNNHPNGKSSPEPFHTAAQQTLGVYRGLPRRSPSGRRRAHPSCLTGLTGLTGLTHAPRRHAPQTAVAIKQAYPTGISAAAPNQTAACKPTGYTVAHQSLSYRSYRSYKSYASATPPPPANHRCHQASTPQRHIFVPRPANHRCHQASATPPQPAHRRCHQKARIPRWYHAFFLLFLL